MEDGEIKKEGTPDEITDEFLAEMDSIVDIENISSDKEVIDVKDIYGKLSCIDIRDLTFGYGSRIIFSTPLPCRDRSRNGAGMRGRSMAVRRRRSVPV